MKGLSIPQLSFDNHSEYITDRDNLNAVTTKTSYHIEQSTPVPDGFYTIYPNIEQDGRDYLMTDNTNIPVKGGFYVKNHTPYKKELYWRDTVFSRTETLTTGGNTLQIGSTAILDGASINFPTLTATGYAVVSTQPGKNVAQKRLMAIRAARMAAMRELAEQIHGLKVDSRTTVIDLVTQNDTFRTMVQGTIRGAKTVRINPTGDDTYETVLEIDREIMLLLLREARSIKA